MSLSIEQLSDLQDDILRELPDKITGILSKLNRSGQIEELLSLMGMSNLLSNDNELQTYKNGKIVVVGGTDVKEKVLLGIAKDLGFDKERFEFCLDYEQLQNYNFRKMQYAPQYRVILAGPMPHSGQAKGDSGSILAELEKSSAYPRCERLMSGQELKITKTNFREKMEQLISEEFI